MGEGKNFKTIVFVIYFLLGLYFLNVFFVLVTFPEYVIKYIRWIDLVTGILLIFGGINFLRLKKKSDLGI